MDIIFWGATGQARVLYESITGLNYKLIACFDNREITSPFIDIPLYFGEAAFQKWKTERLDTAPVAAAVAIGGNRGFDRLKIQEWLNSNGVIAASIKHRTAFIAQDAMLGDGIQVLAMSSVCTNVTIGKACIINTAATIDHCCTIGDGVHIAPGAHLAGEVIVDDFSFIGTGVIILPRVKIGSRAVIGAGAVVTKDVKSGTTVIGNPANQI